MISQIIKNLLLDHDKLVELAKESFKEADQDGSGEIDVDELKDVLIKLTLLFKKEPPSEEDILDIIYEYDENGDGQFDLNSYYFIFKDILTAIMNVNARLEKEKREKEEKEGGDEKKEK